MSAADKKDIVVDMLSWIVDGNFAGVYTNDKKSKVLEKLGAPLDWGTTIDWHKSYPNYMDADAWSYGVWVLYFLNDQLDQVSFVARAIEECGWCFSVVNKDFILNKTKEDISAFFEEKLKVRVFFVKSGKVRTTNIETGESWVRYARGVPYLAVGDELRTVIRFFKDQEGIDVINHPFNIKRQIAGAEKIDFDEKLKVEDIEAED